MKRAILLLCAMLLAGCVTIGGWQWFALASTRGLRVGMTFAELQAMMPYPKDINRTAYDGGLSTQYVWTAPGGGLVCVYVEGDRVTGWQD